MHNLFIGAVLFVLCGFLDRLGGGGFAFLGISENHWLGKGHKWARRYGIPVVAGTVACLRFGFTWERVCLAIVLSVILSLDLAEIVERDWDEIIGKPLVLALLLKLMGFSWWGLLVPAWWFLGVFLSNIGVNGWRLGWHWVEIIRGAVIGKSIWFVLAVMVAVSAVSPVRAEASVPSELAVQVIVGEAANQGPRGMLAVAEVLRRRGSVRPFCASRRKNLKAFVRRQGYAVQEQAERAWEMSRWSNVTKGATHYATVECRPRWARHMVKVARIGDHVFYREA